MARKRKDKSKTPGDRHPADRSASESTGAENFLVERLLGILVLMLLATSVLVPRGTAEQFPNWLPWLIWMFCAAAWTGLGIFKRRYPPAGNAIDLCVYGVCIWAAISGLVTVLTESGHARPTINASWQWIGFGVAYYLIRQMVLWNSLGRKLVLVMILMAVGCSIGGLFQRYMLYPAMWENYRNLPEAQKQNAMREGGLSDVSPGSRERQLWENRLFATEPTSTFVLANSLAAFLTPWMVILMAAGYRQFRAKSYAALLLTAIGAAIVLLCLILTKSRTAYVAVLIGILTWQVLDYRARRKRFPWIAAIVILLVAGLLGGVALAAGLIDREVLTEALKSLTYRWEYWQASLLIIRDHLLFGCGPGNFQQVYAGYQLTQSSETVSDPHNFLFEIWSVAGTPALLFLLGGIGLWIRRNLGADSTTIDLEEADSQQEAKTDRSGAEPFWLQVEVLSALLTGTLVASGIAVLADLDPFVILVSGTTAAVLGMIALQVRSFQCIDSTILKSGLIAWLTGLLASGGISFPGVVSSGLVLLALTAGNRMVANDNRAMGDGPRAVGLLLLLVWVGMVFGFRATVFDPIRLAQVHANRAQRHAINGRLESALEAMDRAIIADPYDGNYLFFKLQLFARRFEREPTLENLREMENLASKSAKVRPNNSRVTLESAKIFLSILLSQRELDQNVREAAGQAALRLLEQSTARRPNDALHAAYRALALAKTGKTDEARKWAGRALELDARNPHADKALAKRVFRIDGYNSTRDIEHQLREIRKQ